MTFTEILQDWFLLELSVVIWSRSVSIFCISQRDIGQPYNTYQMKQGSSLSTENQSQKPFKKQLLKEQIKSVLNSKTKRQFQGSYSQVINKQQPEVSNRGKKKTIATLEDLQSSRDLKMERGFEFFFQIGNKIGEGHHSTVHVCTEKATGKQYAVKIIKKADLQLFSSIRESYRILNKLKHDSIVRPKLLFINEKIMTCHLVQELCEDPDLANYLAKKEKLESVEICEILTEILKVVSYLHAQGVCHRDLKPDNIMYNPVKRKIKVIDFELSTMRKYSNQKFQMFTRTGIPNYRAPETFRSIYNQKVDEWACGVMAYLMITGRYPFNSNHDGKLISKIINEEPDYGCVAWYEKTLLSNLLNKNPSERITAEEALSQLYFSVNFHNQERTPKLKASLVKSPSLGKKGFQESLEGSTNSLSGAWDDAAIGSFLGHADLDSQILFLGEQQSDVEEWP